MADKKQDKTEAEAAVAAAEELTGTDATAQEPDTIEVKLPGEPVLEANLVYEPEDPRDPEYGEDGLDQYGRREQWYEQHPGHAPRVLREIAALEARLAVLRELPL